MKMIDFDWALERMAEWVRVKEYESENMPNVRMWNSLKISAADVDHSVLLRRLLEGKRPFKVPPPLSFSYPWYEVMDGKVHIVFEVWFDSKQPRVVLNQTSWNVLRTEGDVYIIQNGRDKEEWKLWKRPDEELAVDKTTFAGFNEWKLQRKNPAEEFDYI